MLHLQRTRPMTPSRISWRNMRPLPSSLTRRMSRDAGKKPRVVILGSGWGGFRLARDLDKSRFEVTIISPRNHFLFTPLLPSTTTGTLEFRCVQEPVRTLPGVRYFQSRAQALDLLGRRVTCVEEYIQHQRDKLVFTVPYDHLVIAVGTKSATFGVPGLESREEEGGGTVNLSTGTGKHNVMFLKQLEHARSIRNRIIECFERASSPHQSAEERSRLLTVVVVGGGPTSVEFTSELHDFLVQDVARWYPDLASQVRVVVVEAGKHLLGSFAGELQAYVEGKLRKRERIRVLTEYRVQEVKPESVVLVPTSSETTSHNSGALEIPFGICVWSTGNEALQFVRSLKLKSTPQGRILINDRLQPIEMAASHPEIFSLGDCAANEKEPLAQLAQVANQQGKYLATELNRLGGDQRSFRYAFLGSMAQLGLFDAIVETPFRSSQMKGLFAFLAWRSAYWTYSVSITNKILIPMYWFKTFWFGRDISKF